MQPQLDPQLVNLAKAIRQTESGGNFQAKGASGEYGAYQFTEPTWNGAAAKYGINVPLSQATPEQQNEVAYKQLAGWKASHPDWNIGNFASAWNAGEGRPDAYLGNAGVNKFGVKYDTTAYAKSVATAYQTIKQGGQATVDPNNPSSTSGTQYAQPQQDNGSSTFQSSPTDSPLTAGLKTLGNVPGSLLNFGKGILNTFNPIQIAQNVAQIPGAFQDVVNQTGGVGSALSQTAQALPGELYKAAVPEAGRELLKGDFQGAQQAITNDPVGQIAPFLLAADGLANKMGYGAEFDSAISKTARPVMDTAGAIASGPMKLAGGILKSAASHLTTLPVDDITTILKNGEAVKALQQDALGRGGLANEFGSAIDRVEGTLQETGKAYDPIRASDTQATLPENFIPSVLEKFGLKLTDGQVIADTKSITRNTSDIKAVQNFVDNWGDKTTITPHEYLNMRKDIAGMAKFGKEIGTNVDAQKIGTELYAEANKTVRPQIEGLKQLDEQYSPLRQQFDQIKKDFLKKETDGGYAFKDGAINKIFNASGAGKDALLSRMEEVMPGITQRIKLYKAVESIEKAYEMKVGSYTRSMIQGGAVLTGNVPAIIASIISNPSIAVPLLRGLGYSAAKVAPIVSTLKMIAGDVNHLKLPTASPIIVNPKVNQ